jgi:hypothetical protein
VGNNGKNLFVGVSQSLLRPLSDAERGRYIATLQFLLQFIIECQQLAKLYFVVQGGGFINKLGGG